MNSKDLTPLKGLVQHFKNWEEIPKVDAVVIMTPRPAFSHLNWKVFSKKTSAKTAKPTLVVDARAMGLENSVLTSGCAYKALWQPMKLSEIG